MGYNRRNLEASLQLQHDAEVSDEHFHLQLGYTSRGGSKAFWERVAAASSLSARLYSRVAWAIRFRAVRQAA